MSASSVTSPVIAIVALYVQVVVVYIVMSDGRVKVGGVPSPSKIETDSVSLQPLASVTVTV